MIINSNGMRALEAVSGISAADLMETAGQKAAEAVRQEVSPETRILILAGSGNNGGDGFVICRHLKEYTCRGYLADGAPKTPEAQAAFSRLPKSAFITARRLRDEIRRADLIIDAVYGFGYHGELKPEVRKVFRMVNESRTRVFSIDINSGCEADTDHHDKDAIRSDITFALDCFKPVHMLGKEIGVCREVRLLDLGLPHDLPTAYPEMNEEIFFRNFPHRSDTMHKNSFGRTLIVGGCYGMAGAVSLNILGARTVGAPYIECALPDSIYPIVAQRHMTAVFHPFSYHTVEQVVEPLSRKAKAIVFGSGAVNMDRKQQCMDMILQSSTCPVILDAEALRLLHQNTYILRFVKCPLILTPHIGEFASILNKPVEEIRDNRMKYAVQFAKENRVIVVLKGANTIVASPIGEVYINQSGNPALAQAGSGDLLAGIIAGLLTMTRDIYTAVCMGVWLHGHLADIGLEKHSMQAFNLESYPELMDALFRKYHF